MATLEDVIAKGQLEPFEVPEWETRSPIRPLWVPQSLMDWGDNKPELHDPKLAVGGRTLFEHLERALSNFRCDTQVHYGDIKRMVPTKEGVWHMYPPGLRVYGWCPRQHSFVAVTGALESDTKSNRSLNDQKRDEVLQFIENHKLQGEILRGDFFAVFPHKSK